MCITLIIYDLSPGHVKLWLFIHIFSDVTMLYVNVPCDFQ